ncbi:undecaprenyldiphospho-muramoylpentapeptide beta-N-acetylglucosaminyltransferase [Aquabacter spiritensis]|uniref:UDP-N-acetylglucosamine--N-acetylmuramyl-(pentapeptide) pyrophosphoryl-undecaprenol N-acetylglucosamine transferase n=1 Tax=Aquabacter spiritensis TaxID=933073 RepID=A0A4V2UYB1_9HYPH|nr:undecaprenyldiphospho-muramoylpentapeptide beta-N-acetylglucosaminyltransferase [Aquabacter spiritensis]TCT06708.1 UDP-N-acetylglucosamine-N-acetylmuramylpentapeptide N-acetylglucosamine transferase [Aquabacter spiritensis]
MSPQLALLAAGGTGGHLFPAEALAAALEARGLRVDLATDHRAARYVGAFPAGRMHILPSETVRGRSPVALAKTAYALASGLLAGLALMRRLKPAVVVGFGGYPTLPPLVAARLRGVPTLIHEANGVMGRANRLLAPRVTAIATGFPGICAGEPALAEKAVWTGNPLRAAVISAAALPFPPTGEAFRLLVFGGSQGARVMADVVPDAVARLEPALRARLRVVQQARPEDIERVREAYARAGVAADIAPFFKDLPERMAQAHLVISRSGASTVAELAAIGRPAVLVPLPHALDQDQAANARLIERAGGALLVPQDAFTPERVAGELRRLAADPHALTAMAEAARSAGALDAADRLADLVVHLARGAPIASFEGRSTE